jgi:hypothetical protein
MTDSKKLSGQLFLTTDYWLNVVNLFKAIEVGQLNKLIRKL